MKQKNRNPALNTTALVYGKVPPQAPKLEEGVLGALLIEKDRYPEIATILASPGCFYLDAHRKIYSAMQALYERGDVIDLLTVPEQLRKQGELEIVGGEHFLITLTMSVVSSAHIVNHARIIFEKFLSREMIRIAGAVISEAYEDGTDPFTLHDQAMHDLARALEMKSKGMWIDARHAVQKFLTERNKLFEPQGNFISTTFTKLDAINGGLKAGHFVLVGARPSVGKSAFITPLILHTSKHYGPVGLINLEMTTSDTVGRMLSVQTGIPFSRLDRDPLLDMVAISHEIDKFGQLPIFFTENVRVNIHNITAAATYLKNKHGIKALFIDYLQLVEEDEQSNNREQAISKISRGLKTLALALGILVIALAQLNRESAKRSDKKPSLTDLRESGSLEQDADVIMLLHRDWMAGITQDAQGNSTEYEADLLIPKWRNGAPVEMPLHFDPLTMRFSEIAPVIPPAVQQQLGDGSWRPFIPFKEDE